MAKIEVKIKGEPAFEEVEYIETSANQWIELPPVYDAEITNLYVDFKCNQGNYLEYVYKINYDDFDTPQPRYYDFIMLSSNSFSYSYDNYPTGGSFADSTTISNRFVLERKSDGVYIDGVLNPNLQNNYTTTGKQTSNIVLFGALTSEDTPNIGKRLYRFKYGNESGWKVDLVPCVRVSDQVAGLFDVINQQFYTNSGAGTLTAGQKTGNTYNIYTINRFNGLKSVESLSQSTTDAKSVNYGVLPSSGSIEIVDSDGVIANKIITGEINSSNIETDILCNDNYVQRHKSNNSDYDVNSKLFSVDFTNKLAMWDNLQYKGLDFNSRIYNAYEILVDILSSINYSVGQIDDMLTNIVRVDTYDLEMTIKTYLQRIEIPYSYLEADSVRNSVDKICQLAQLNVYEDNSGNITFINARPIMSQSSQIISIPKRIQMSNFYHDIILKNKYQDVEMYITQPSDITDYYTTIDTVKSNISISQSISNSELMSGNYDVAATYAASSSYVDQWLSYTKIKNYYYSGTLYMPYKTNNGLTEIKKLYQQLFGENNTPLYTIHYKKYTGTNSAYCNVTGSTVNSMSNYSETITGVEENLSSYFNLSSSTTITDSSYWPVITLTTSVTTTDNSTIQITRDDANSRFVINYNLLVGQDILNMKNKYTTYPPDFDTPNPNIFGTIERNSPVSLEISIYGDKRVISFSDIKESNNSTNEQNVVKLDKNILLQENTVYVNADTKIKDIIKNNILDDYEKGVMTGNITIACSDLYNYKHIDESQLVKNWENGEIVNIGDIVKIDIDNNNNSALYDNNGNVVTFKVVGRKFYYSGVPLLDLQLQEIKTPVHVVTFSDDGVMFDKQFVIENNYAQTPNNLPTKEGYIITGWTYQTGSGTTTITSLNDFEITENYNFTPRWTPV